MRRVVRRLRVRSLPLLQLLLLRLRRPARRFGGTLHHRLRKAGLEAIQVLGDTNEFENLLNLIESTRTVEHGSPAKHLGKYAAERPHVDLHVVLVRTDKDLRRAVPPAERERTRQARGDEGLSWATGGG